MNNCWGGGEGSSNQFLDRQTDKEGGREGGREVSGREGGRG